MEEKEPILIPKPMDQCVDEIFQTVVNENNDPHWRLLKHRFYNGLMAHSGKVKLLKKFGYELIDQATYRKKEEK